MRPSNRQNRIDHRVVNGARGARTLDLLAASQTLSQLSYGPTSRLSVAARPRRYTAAAASFGTSFQSSSSR